MSNRIRAYFGDAADAEEVGHDLPLAVGGGHIQAQRGRAAETPRKLFGPRQALTGMGLSNLPLVKGWSFSSQHESARTLFERLLAMGGSDSSNSRVMAWKRGHQIVPSLCKLATFCAVWSMKLGAMLTTGIHRENPLLVYTVMT